MEKAQSLCCRGFFVKYKLWDSVIQVLSVWVVWVGTTSKKLGGIAPTAESWDSDWRLWEVACCAVSSLCDCIVFALSEWDLKERVACGCVPYAFLVSLLFGYNLFPNLGHVNVMSPKQACDPKLIPLPLTTYIV